MGRPHDIVIPPNARWLNDAGAQAVCRAIGAPIYFVGGCVRNALLGAADNDIDFATPLHPEQVMERAHSAGLKAVPTGIEHGTVTVVSGGQGFEVTTFRRDIETDGRRAVVAFADNIKDDARRRDFTMNALYATPTGEVIDPLGGMDDLLARRVRFIEDAGARIREDYLRTLRYFRFHAWYGDDAQGFDPEALAAIGAELAGLETLSVERVAAELRKLLSAPDPVFAVAGMRSTGVTVALLPGMEDAMLGPLVHNEGLAGLAPDWMRRLAVMCESDTLDHLRFSKSERRNLKLLRDHGFGVMPLTEVAYRYGIELAVSALVIRASMAGLPVDPDQMSLLETAARQVFPIRAADLIDQYQGPALGAKLAALESAWIASGFTLDRAALLTGV